MLIPERKRSVVLVLLVVATQCAVHAAMYSGGTGTPDDPYRIATPEDLNEIGNHEKDWDSHFFLVKDIDLSEYTGTMFNRIGDWGPPHKPFTGVFDGNNHRILNFTWDSVGVTAVGLFGYISATAEIRNLGMENEYVNDTAGRCVGGLVGLNNGGTVTACYATGVVRGSWSVGGLVGINYGNLTDCYTTASVTGNGYSWLVGGLLGPNSKPILPTTRQGYDGRCPLALSKV